MPSQRIFRKKTLNLSGTSTFSIGEGRDCLQTMPSKENEEKNSTFSIGEGRDCLQTMPSKENEEKKLNYFVKPSARKPVFRLPRRQTMHKMEMNL